MPALIAAILMSVAGPTAMPVQSLHTPDQIAPAVLPYLACLFAARGLPLLRGTDGKPITTERPTNGDCSTAKIHARREALKLLEGKELPKHASPEAFVDDTLFKMDSYVASMPSQSSGADSQDLPMVEGTPVTIEDEVQPAYTKYNACLREKLKESHVTATNVLGIFSDALVSCRDVRALSVNEARQALAAKGWDEQARERAAENSFAKSDESWTTMGHRLHDALLQRDQIRNRGAHANKQQ